MAPQPRWTIPVNFRAQDKSILDAALSIAKKQDSDLTSVIRTALKVYTTTKMETSGIQKIDDFLDNSVSSDPIYNRLLTPKELSHWPDNNLLDFARHLKSRRQEVDAELRNRGFFIRW